MEATIETTITVNGAAVTRAVPARQHLIDFLRETLGLTGSHVGCEHGVCGACTVRVDGEIVRGCLMLAVQANGRKVDTIEGLSDSGELAELQRGFHEHNALQCGFCTPGMLMAAHDLVRTKPRRHARRDPRVHGRQLLPLHRLPGDRRRDRRGARAPWPSALAHAGAKNERPRRAAASRPRDAGRQGLHRPERAARRTRSACCRAAARSSTTCASRASRTSCSSAARMRTPKVKKLDLTKAARQPGVIACFDGRAVAEYCTPWVAVLGHLKGIKSAPQYAIAIERACWQGEAVAAIVAETREQGEDALGHVVAEWEELPVVTDMEDALADRYVIHPDLGDNICFKRELDTGGVDDAFAKADVVVEETYVFGRHTGVCLEPRAILADYNAAEHSLTVYHSTQAPHMMQDIFSRHLDIPEANVRVICKDVGGSFGIKVHVYADEMATAAISVMLRRPVKFVADRLESFLTDIHAREHKAKVRLACTKAGDILAFDLDDLTAIGPYSVYPRTSGIEGNQVVNLTGGPYKHQRYRAKMHVVFTNKNVTCQYRAVGHPIAVALTEGIVDLAAAKIGMDPAEFRRRNLIADDAYPYTFPSGIKFEKLSHHKCLDQLLALMDYKKLRAEQAELRKKGVQRGIGLAAMIEVTNPSPAFYGVGGARISAQDGATLRLEPTGMVTVLCSVTEQGQGTDGDLRADRGERARRDDGQGASHHRRHRGHALRRRDLGVARRGHRRRSGAAGRPGAALEHPRHRGGRPRDGQG